MSEFSGVRTAARANSSARNGVWHPWIGGDWAPVADGATFDSDNPATGKSWAVVGEAGPEDVDRAVAAALSALHLWRRVEPADRGRLLWKLAELIETESEDIARMETMGNGKTIRETRGEVRAAANYLRYQAGFGDKLTGETLDHRTDMVMMTHREPYGVVGAITPWNSPFVHAVRKMAPAVIVGNTVVIKPPEVASVSSIYLGSLAARAGFPPGVVNVVPGMGDRAGASLVRHPGIGKISFTGARSTGMLVARDAADRLAPTSLELGGKAPHIVFADGDIESAVITAVNASFGSAGQSCTAGSRIFIERRALPEFTERYLAYLGELTVGDPLDPATDIGSLASAAHLSKVSEYFEIAREEGASLVRGGHRLEDGACAQGYFLAPTVYEDVKPDMRIAQEEIFGPISMFLPFEDEEEVLAAANDVPYGLTAGLWTSDLTRAHMFIQRLEAGTVWVNCFRTAADSLAYGGYKASGYGRENGLEGLLSFTRTKAVMIDLAPASRPDGFGLRATG